MAWEGGAVRGALETAAKAWGRRGRVGRTIHLIAHSLSSGIHQCEGQARYASLCVPLDRCVLLRILSLAHGWEYRVGSALIVLLPDLRSFILPTDYELILLNIWVDALFLMCYHMWPWDISAFLGMVSQQHITLAHFGLYVCAVPASDTRRLRINQVGIDQISYTSNGWSCWNQACAAHYSAAFSTVH